MPVPTPEQLELELPRHNTIAEACRALGSTKAGVYYRRPGSGDYQHPQLVAICQAHVASRKVPRDARGKAGEHTIALPPEILARLDALAAERAAKRGGKRAFRSAVARELLETALQGPLPPPLPGERGMAIKLDLGPTWSALAAALGTDDPQAIAGAVRAILASGEKSTGGAKKG